MAEKTGVPTPAISLPKGGGAIKGIGETFQPNLFTGTGNFSIPIATSPGRSGFGPQLTLQYSTGNGNGPFGLGWQLSIPRVTRKTEKGLPTYDDEKDVFVISGAEDLVPVLDQNTRQPVSVPPQGDFTITRYRPRTEGLFARIERWANKEEDVHWRATTIENVTSVYGRTKAARIIDPETENKPPKEQHVFEWLLEETYDAKGNHILYEYARDDPDLDLRKIYEENRGYCQRYIRRVYYGNLPKDEKGNPITYLIGDPIGHQRNGTDHNAPASQIDRRYAFELVFDYGDLGFPPYTAISERTNAERVQTVTHPGPIPIDQQELFGPDPSQSQGENAVPVRPDSFSTFRPGFEIRTLRICRRILMIHHFWELGEPTVVRSTDFEYHQNPDTLLRFLESATVTGYRKEGDKYIQTSMPPVTFKYSEFKPKERRYQSVTAEGKDLPPVALNNPNFTLIDLSGNGLPDILNTTANGYYYWENLGEARLDRRRPQPMAPAGVVLADANVAIGDMGGDGLPDLVVEAPLMFGAYEATPEGNWKPFKRVDKAPSFSLADPNVRLVDLTGDGLSDVLVTRDHHFQWFPCTGEKGYGEPIVEERKHDLNEFPDIYFDDPTGRVRLADMTGDGLNDIVLVHEGSIEYWPNLGYGRFGKRITMANAARLEGNFDPRRLFLVDLDGSGCADLVYVDFGSVHFWFNQSGNGWSGKQTIPGTPAVSDFTAIQFADFFGTGTATLVWSYDYNSQLGGNYKVLDFCGGVKPYLLVRMDNHMGATTRAQYAPSTRFYLEDKKAGQPWVTNLPFPVQVLEKVEVIDHISKTKLVTTYKYHHGYYDSREREFRGFGRVDQCDTEIFETFAKAGLHNGNGLFTNAQKAFHVPPVLTKNWFHTGIYFDENLSSASGVFYDQEDMMKAYRTEFYNGDKKAFQLENHEVEPTDTPHEAYRALRGSLIRSEIYAQDETKKAWHPYTVMENRFCVKQLQPRGSNFHAVYLALKKESFSYHYERNPDDPRIAHQINIEYDNYGNLLKSIAITYPRRKPFLDSEEKPYPEQSEPKAIYTFTRYINEVIKDSYYYIGLPCETKVFEVHGMRFQWPIREGVVAAFKPDEFEPLKDRNEYMPFESKPLKNRLKLKKRIIEWNRQYYRKDTNPERIDPVGDLSHRLELGTVESLALPYESYQAAFTRTYINKLLPDNVNISDNKLRKEGGYHQEPRPDPGPDPDPQLKKVWWIPSGRRAFSKEKFYVSEETQDPFGNKTFTAFDDYGLLLKTVTDAVQNVITAENDYRVLQPCRVTDPNDNISQIAFDALGMVVATAVMGKPDEHKGDIIDNTFEPDLDLSQIQEFVTDPHGKAQGLLKSATTRLVYDLYRYQRCEQPPFAGRLAREIHSNDSGGSNSPIQISFVYSDGFGREIQTKIQAEAGDAPRRDTDIPLESGDIQPGDLSRDDNGKIIQAKTNQRFVGTGRIVWNAKGKPVKKYEQFFSSTHLYESEPEMTNTGVTPILFYDPAERVVATLHPNHTYEKVHFDPWQQTTWDADDTLHPPQNDGDPPFDPKDDANVGEYFRRLPENEYLPTWYDLRMDTAKAMKEWPDFDDNGTPIEDNREIRAAEKRAALNAAKHAETPAVAHLDVMGRQFLSVADNGKGVHFITHVELDIEGNDISITDPRTIKAFAHTFDMAGRKLKVDSTDAGIRTNLPDISGENPWLVWDANEIEIRTEYDALRRPVRVWVKKDGKTRLVNHTQYGDEEGKTGATKLNLRGQITQILDDAGEIINQEFDFKGNLLETRRKLLSDYKLEVDWSGTPAPDLDMYTYTSINKYDALNRITESIAPDDSNQKITYNEANFLETVKVRLKGEADDRDFVRNINYNARGQRELIEYGNGVTTVYSYDPENYRLLSVVSKKLDGVLLQDLRYTYDPVGNIAQIQDGAFHAVFNHNQRIASINKYAYDPTYRLIKASGREHEAMTACHYQTRDKKHPEFIPRSNQPLNNGQALHNYAQIYQYDENGNITRIRHVGNSCWIRIQEYPDTSNRLKHSVANQALCAGEVNFEFLFDSNGNIRKMPHLGEMKWDYANRLIEVETNIQTNVTNDRVFYNYDANGQRVRKVIEQGNVRVEERIYVGEYEIYRKYNGADTTFERSTLHVMDDKRRIALIEIEDPNNIDSGPDIRVRFQLDNHLGSSLLEVDENAREISYEEYYPYGGTAYLAGENWAEVKLKRYRYSGKERDEETGLYYYGARYYAPWLGRWASADPTGMVDGTNLFAYSRNNPLIYADLTGMQSESTMLSCVDQTAPTQREEAELRSIPEEHPAGDSGTPSRASTADAIRAETKDEIRRRESERILNLDMPPGEAFDYPEAYIPYAIFYGLKHGIYVPIREFFSPTPISYLDSKQRVKEYTGPRDHTDALVATVEIVLLFLPTPKVGIADAVLAEKTVLIAGRGSALQAEVGANVVGFKIRGELVVEARWVGRGVHRSNILGYERGVLFRELRENYPGLFSSGRSNPKVTSEFAQRFPEYRPYIGERLVEHHLGHGALTYPLPESVHRAQSRSLHGTVRQEH